MSATLQISHDFDFLFGRWQVNHHRRRNRLTGSDSWECFSGEMTCRPILDGVGNIDEFRVPEVGAIGSTLRLFDLDAQVWSIYWSSRRTGRLEPPLHGAFEDGVGVFFGDDVHAGRRIRVRFIWQAQACDAATWEQAFSGDSGVSWETNWMMELTRHRSRAQGADRPRGGDAAWHCDDHLAISQ